MQEFLQDEKIPHEVKCDAKYYLKFDIDYTQWRHYFLQVNKPNLLQSWFYGEAKKKSQGWSVKRAIIFENEQPIALLQILYKTFLFVKIIRLNQGPLWLIDKPSVKQVEKVLHAITRQWSIRKASILSIAPNLINDFIFREILSSLGFKKKSSFTLESGLINLSIPETEMLNRLRSNWRRALRSAEKNKLIFTVSQSREDFQWLISRYLEYQKQKTFLGPPIPLLSALYDCANDFQDVWIAFVLHENRRIANLLVASHGATCSPLVSCISDEGRELNAGNFILWNSILHAKNKGHKWFDQGGLNGKHSSVAKFKRGIPSDEYQLIGEYLVW